MDESFHAVNDVYRFVITGKPRSQKNSKQIIKARGRMMLVNDAKTQRWKKDAIKQLEAQWRDRKPMDGALGVTLVAYLGKGQRGDTDNLAAGPLDALQKAKVVRNDSIFQTVFVMRRRDPENPRVDIHIFPDEWLDLHIKPNGCFGLQDFTS